MQTLINARQRPVIPRGDALPRRTLLDLPGQLALVSPLALCQLLDCLAAGARAGGLVCMRVHHTPGNFAPPALSSVLRWLLKLVPSQYAPTMPSSASTAVMTWVRRVSS